MIRACATRFASDRVAPCVADFDAREAFFDYLYRELAQQGLLGIGSDQRCGGAGADPLAYALVMEELARDYSSVADQCGLVELVATLLEQHGSPEQQERYLLPLLRGERKCTFALTENEAGSDVAGLKTRATRTDGGLAPERLEDVGPQRPHLRLRGRFGSHGRRQDRIEHVDVHRGSRRARLQQRRQGAQDGAACFAAVGPVL